MPFKRLDALQLASRLVGWLNHDFCPGANRWVHWMKHPTVPLIVAAFAALICGVMVNPSAILLAASLPIVLLLGVVWPWVALLGLRVELEFEHRRATEGEPTGVLLKIHNKCPWPVWGLTLDRGFRRFGRERTAWALARVAGWSTTQLRFEFTPDARGEFPCEPARTRTAFPFGLWHSERAVEIKSTLLVWPRVIPLESIPDSADLRESPDRMAPRRVGDMGDLMGTRLFRQGDSLRRVHWSQTARQGKMIVCERQAAAQSAVQVVVDLDPNSHSVPGPDGTLEWTIRVAASICDCLRKNHAWVECVVGSDRIIWPEGAVGRQRLLDHLARLPFEGRALSPSATKPARLGLLQFVCTTPRGMATGVARGPVQTTRFVAVDSTSEAESDIARPHAAIRLVVGDNPLGENPATRFRQEWERSCHASAR